MVLRIGFVCLAVVRIGFVCLAVVHCETDKSNTESVQTNPIQSLYRQIQYGVCPDPTWYTASQSDSKLVKRHEKLRVTSVTVRSDQSHCRFIERALSSYHNIRIPSEQVQYGVCTRPYARLALFMSFSLHPVYVCI